MSLFSFGAKGKQRIARGRKPLITVPPQLASYDPVFDTVDRIENDYHRFARRMTEQRR
ncbi:MAG TPA: hypothetical protein VFW65_06615 [Pseudonocardiaceae bacterium]|nr:hypothetical protein [Pseudonocardiaceae bacterium]